MNKYNVGKVDFDGNIFLLAAMLKEMFQSSIFISQVVIDFKNGTVTVVEED